MRHYETGEWGMALLFSLRGSVFPKACAWALPGALLTVGVNYMSHMDRDLRSTMEDTWAGELKTSQVFVAYNFLLAFVLTFRSTQAYSRWWEGATLLLQARGEWFNAYSSLIAFRTTNAEMWKETKSFEKILATLMSLLFCSALNSVAQDTMDFEVRSHVELNEESAALLRNCSDKCEVIIHWIQRLVVANMETGVIPTPPPVLSRVFQELSRGMVNIHNARKISDFLLPFPYAQLTSLMLLVNSIFTPLVLGIFLTEWYTAGVLSFVSVFAFSAVNCIAAEIECPFGADENDLPLQAMQEVFNRSLTTLLDTRAQRVPCDQTQVAHGFESMDHVSSYNLRHAKSVMGMKGYRQRYRLSTHVDGLARRSSWTSGSESDDRPAEARGASKGTSNSGSGVSGALGSVYSDLSMFGRGVRRISHRLSQRQSQDNAPSTLDPAQSKATLPSLGCGSSAGDPSSEAVGGVPSSPLFPLPPHDEFAECGTREQPRFVSPPQPPFADSASGVSDEEMQGTRVSVRFSDAPHEVYGGSNSPVHAAGRSGAQGGFR
mmetsp:Transcript_59614/g.172663  ORF Transcript_59614/g.172663 Transcript_59614/m.172663 type:complete len:547 (-) Transcript_59614:135-1775(-)